MFERFTTAATALVLVARDQQEALKSPRIGTEHLLLALALDDGPTGATLRGHGLDADLIKTEMSRPSERDDRRLLESLGIDLDAVRQSIDRAFGPGALDRARDDRLTNPAPSGRWRKLRTAKTSGRFDQRSKRVLESSLREALRLKSNHIGPVHIGLGLLSEDGGGARTLLMNANVSLDNLRSDWENIAQSAKVT